MEVTDSDGVLKQLIKTNSIKINGELKESLFTVDSM
jgi:hypothetical protein